MKKGSRYFLLVSLMLFCTLIGCNKTKEDTENNIEAEKLHAIKLDGGRIERILTNDNILFMKEIISSNNKICIGNISYGYGYDGVKIVSAYEPVIYNVNTKEEQKFNNVKSYYNYSVSPKGKYLVYDEVRENTDDEQRIKVLNIETGKVNSLEMVNEVNLDDINWHSENEFSVFLRDRSGQDIGYHMYKYNLDELDYTKIDLSTREVIGVEENEIYYLVGREPYNIYKYNIENGSEEEVCSSIKGGYASRLYMFNNVFVSVGIDETKYTKKQLDEEKYFYNYIIKIFDKSGNLLNEAPVSEVINLEYVKYDEKEKFVIYTKYESNYSSPDSSSYIKKLDLESGETETLLVAKDTVKIHSENEYITVEAKSKYDFTSSSYIISNFNSGEKIAHKDNEKNKKVIKSALENYKGKKCDDELDYLYKESIILDDIPYHYIQGDGKVILLNNNGEEVKLPYEIETETTWGRKL